MRETIDTLKKSSTVDAIKAAVDYVAGMPRSAHSALLDEIHKKTGKSLEKLWMWLERSIEVRAVTKYSDLKLKTFLLAGSTGGRIEDDCLIVPDPLQPGDELFIRDAVLLNHQPIVQKKAGYSHAIDSYIEVLIDGADTSQYRITRREISAMVAGLNDCDKAAKLRPAALASPNLQVFEQYFGKDAADEPLMIALRMNTRYCLVDNGGQMIVMDRKTLGAYKREEFAAKIANEKHQFGNKIVPRSKIWMEHAARLTYQGVTSAPMGFDKNGRLADLSRTLNLWTGFAQEGVPGASWELLKDHIATILCDGNQVAFEYVLNWLAHLLQKPWEKPGVAIVVWGLKRTGKGTVADAVRDICGSMLSRMITQKEHVVGRFSISTQPLLFSQIEEALFAKNPREEGPLKSKITDVTENIELKFKQPYELPSFGRYWFNSNSETPVPVTPDEERYFILHVNPSRASDHAYFKKIRDQLYHEGGLAAMVHELTHRDIKEFNVRAVPQSAAKGEMVFEMLDHAERAVADILTEGRVTFPGGNDPERDVTLNFSTPTWVDKSLVMAVLNSPVARYGARDATQQDVTKLLMRKLRIVERMRNAHGKRNHKAGYLFLPLEEARKRFAEALDVPLKRLSPDLVDDYDTAVEKGMAYVKAITDDMEMLEDEDWTTNGPLISIATVHDNVKALKASFEALGEAIKVDGRALKAPWRTTDTPGIYVHDVDHGNEDKTEH